MALVKISMGTGNGKRRGWKRTGISVVVLAGLFHFVAFRDVSQPNKQTSSISWWRSCEPNFNYNNSNSRSVTSAREKDSSRPSSSSWPGIPHEELGHPLVQIGHNFVQNARELLLAQEWDAFWEAYQKRPDPANRCGIRINHAYALWLTCKQLKPTTVLESGVNAGQSTYFLRAALPDATIYAIDPAVKPICDQDTRWIDTFSHKTVYLTGPRFRDVAQLDWGRMIQDGLDVDRTLVFLDDHQDAMHRIAVLLRHGVRHVLMEDNYKQGEGSTDADKAGFTMKQLFRRKDRNSEFMFRMLLSYSEFPPLVPPTMASAHKEPKKISYLHHQENSVDMNAPILRPDLDRKDQELYMDVCKRLGLDPTLEDEGSYKQMMMFNNIAYLELAPFSPRIGEHLTHLQ